MGPWVYQNGGDWPWFGGRWIQVLIAMNMTELAELYLQPMIDAVVRHNGFYEWFDPNGNPQVQRYILSNGLLIHQVLNLC